MPKLSISLVVRNGAKYIPFLFASLKRQTFKDWEIIFVNDASTDNTAALVKKELDGSNIPYRVIESSVNIGFSPGHNLAFKEAAAPYVLLQNVDMYLMPDALEKMIAFLDAHPDTAAVAPRLMRWDFERAYAAYLNGSSIIDAAKEGFTSQIDAIGIRLFKNRRAVEWLTRQEWVKDSENKDVRQLCAKAVQEVFGVSGAFPLYRREILERVLLPGNVLFDPAYHSYKEDLDLAYRLRNAGYVSYALLNAVAYHDRTGAGPKQMSDAAALKNKMRQSYFVRLHSYKNHLRTLYKNEYWQNLILDLPFIFWYELKKLLYLLVFDPVVVFRGWKEIISNFSYTRAARESIIKTRRMHWMGIRRWF